MKKNLGLLTILFLPFIPIKAQIKFNGNIETVDALEKMPVNWVVAPGKERLVMLDSLVKQQGNMPYLFKMIPAVLMRVI